jgi:hypothetical protein
MQYLA